MGVYPANQHRPLARVVISQTRFSPRWRKVKQYTHPIGQLSRARNVIGPFPFLTAPVLGSLSTSESQVG